MGQKLLRFDGFYVCLEPRLIYYDEPHAVDFKDTEESYRENPVILMFYSEGHVGYFAMGQKTDVPIPYNNIREFMIENFLPLYTTHYPHNIEPIKQYFSWWGKYQIKDQYSLSISLDFNMENKNKYNCVLSGKIKKNSLDLKESTDTTEVLELFEFIPWHF